MTSTATTAGAPAGVGGSSSKWLPLESNPDMLTSFIRSLGVSGPTRFVDVWSFDQENLGFFPRPILAVCVLYPSDEVDEARKKQIPKEQYVQPDGSKCLYIRQRMDEHGNACGSIALLHSVCNNAAKLEFQPGSPLLEFARQNKGLNAEKLADHLQAAKALHSVTETVAAQGQTATPEAEDEVNHHFIAFIRSEDGRLLELDGMKLGPVDHGPCSPDDLFEKAIHIIRDEMMTKTSNLNFSALALTTAPDEDE